MSRPELIAPPEMVSIFIYRYNMSTKFSVSQYYGDTEAKKYTNKRVSSYVPRGNLLSEHFKHAYTTDSSRHDIQSTRTAEFTAG